MRKLIFPLLLLIFELFSVTNSTINMNMLDYSYIANHLTSEECRRLVASLHFVSYDLPAALSAAEKTIPEDIPCFKLLIKWDSGTSKWEGKGKSHVDVANRLRQIGRTDLAVWLEQTVFFELTKELNLTLLYPAFIENISNAADDLRKYEDKGIANEHLTWTSLDLFLWVFVTLLSFMVMVTFCRILYLTCKKDGLRKNVDLEQMADLLGHESVDSEQETIYEFVVNKNASDNNNNENLDR